MLIDARLMKILRCPCGGGLTEHGDTLSCASCGSTYPVVRGIPRFTASSDSGQAQVSEAFGYKWQRGSEFAMAGETQAIMDDWLLNLRGWTSEAQFARFLAPFKTILDAGSGNGRDVVQLGRLRPDASLGVLHHTPSTEKAVKALYPLLNSGGEFTFTIYRKKAPIREFTDDFVRQKIRSMSSSRGVEGDGKHHAVR